MICVIALGTAVAEARVNFFVLLAPAILIVNAAAPSKAVPCAPINDVPQCQHKNSFNKLLQCICPPNRCPHAPCTRDTARSDRTIGSGSRPSDNVCHAGVWPGPAIAKKCQTCLITNMLNRTVRHTEANIAGALVVGADMVHVWRIRATGCESAQYLYETLSDQERRSAQRLRRDERRRQFIQTRVCLRRVLAGYLAMAPNDVPITYGPLGQPLLDATEPGESTCQVRFNISHSHELALIACTAGRLIGIDVEHLHQDRPFDRLARRYFSTSEYQSMFTGAPGDASAVRARQFLRGWTAKEAVLKARGLGVAGGLASAQVSCPVNAPTRLVQLDNDAVNRWTIRELSSDDDYVTTLAVRGAIQTLQMFDLDAACVFG